MIASISEQEIFEQHIQQLSDHEYVIEGLNYWLNNNPAKSEEFFQLRSDRTTILAGYAFVQCMNGVISHEPDRIHAAQQSLKLLEKQCTTTTTSTTPVADANDGREIAVQAHLQSNWLSHVRYKIFGNVTGVNISNDPKAKSPAQLIEEQVILGECYMLNAILLFLMQDITGLIKGSWLLRKAWKIYQKTYLQLFEMFTERYGNSDEPLPPEPLNYTPIHRTKIPVSFSSINWSTFAGDAGNAGEKPDFRHGFKSQSKTTLGSSPSSHQALNVLSIPATVDNNNIAPHHSSTANVQNNPFRRTFDLKLVNHQYGFNSFKTCPTMATSTGSNVLPTFPKSEVIDSFTLKRLMGASSFGYGLFLLISSLLPSKLLKIISIFGFEGDRDVGLSCLMFARKSTDVRSILATLTLLWFYTFGTQLFFNEDGYTADKIDTATAILNDYDQQYGQSAIFLFFRGRLERMKKNAPRAIESFQKSLRFSAQNELKLLCIHEIAWCRLMRLDYNGALYCFNELRQVSVYSKAFYTYMTIICQGSAGKHDNLVEFKDELATLVHKQGQKQNFIVALIQNHLTKLDENRAGDTFYWRLLTFEILFLWSVLTNIQNEYLADIVNGKPNEDERVAEPSIGLRELILGSVYAALHQYPLAIDAYAKCIAKRESESVHDMHLSAFAHYELATILIHYHRHTDDGEALHRAKVLLQKAQQFQNYDLETRLSVQIQRELQRIE